MDGRPPEEEEMLLFSVHGANHNQLYQLPIDFSTLDLFLIFLPEFLLLKLEFAEKALKPESAEVLNMELELVLEPLSSDKEKIFHKSNKKYFIEKMSSLHYSEHFGKHFTFPL